MPTIVFRVNGNPDVLTLPVPANKDTATFAAEVAAQRVAYFPNKLRDNRELLNGTTFTCTGTEAIYFRNLVNSGQLPFVTIVSTVP